MPYKDYLKQLLSMEMACNNILQWTKDLAPPYAMPYEDSPSDCWFAQSRQSYNFTEVHFIEEILLFLIKHLLSRYSNLVYSTSVGNNLCNSRFIKTTIAYNSITQPTFI